MYGKDRHFVWMCWTLLIAGTLYAGVYLIGKAAHDSNKAEHQQQIECLQAGGEMEHVSGVGGIYCNKDD